MTANFIFISHASEDDAFVKELRIALENLGLPVWVDSRRLQGGDKLAPEIDQAIAQARQVIAVLSRDTINSPWVTREIRRALEVERERQQDGYRVVPLLLPGLKPTALAHWFSEEPVAVPVTLRPGGLSEALPSILAGLGERLADDRQTLEPVTPPPLEELILRLSDPAIDTAEGKRRAKATATLIYQPANPAAERMESRRYSFTAPLGPIETDDLRWYLESYYLWPTGVFRERAGEIENRLPQWGQELYQAALGHAAAAEALHGWQHPAGGERRFSILVDRELPDGAGKDEQAAAGEAASELLSLPWELLHDGRGYLFQGAKAVRVRRRQINRRLLDIVTATAPVRILLLSPRPEDEHTSYIDHRVSALPLMQAVEALGDLAELEILDPPTFPALEQALQHARKAKRPFAVVHFDGHGVYDREHGLGGLCFEHPKDAHKLERRAMQLIHADKLAAVMRDYRIPLVFLEACQSAKVEEDPTASVAARLLEEGVSSVAAMSHSVLVETARRFVEAFYGALARGARVGQAMLAGQQALYGDSYRLKIMGAGELHLQDWFVPVLYQEQQDPPLFTRLLPEQARRLQEQQRRLALGALPAPPPHRFIGRSRELLKLERLLHRQPYAVVQGQGGSGKTTLAVELARWLVRTNRFRRAAFVCVEHISDVRAILDSLGRQLLPEGENWSVAHYPDLDRALQPIRRALSDQPTLLVLDNLESILPDASGQNLTAFPVEDLFQRCGELLRADPRTRLLFTSREPLPVDLLPLLGNAGPGAVQLGPLDRHDAIELVSRIMADNGWEPSPTDPGGTAEEITDLVDAVNGHARALVLLAREVSQQGVCGATADLHRIMADLHRRHPDDRENSLYASVELSLRRLTPETRERVRWLGVFHGGANMGVLAPVMGVDVDTAGQVGAELIQVGLAEDMGYGHLRLDPALPSFLREQLSAAEREQAETTWAEGMAALANFLYQQRFQDTQLSAQLTRLELPNLLALLEHLRTTASAEQLADFAGTLEGLLANLDRPQALARAVAAREQAMQDLGEWSHVRFNAERLSIERLLAGGNVQKAHAAAERLLQRSLATGEAAYKGAAYNIAMAHDLLGTVLRMSGGAEAALSPLAEAERRFQVLAEAGGTDAEHMVSVAIAERGDCLRDLGRLDEAAAAYTEAIERAERSNNVRQVAAGKGNLGLVRLLQGRYAEALAAFDEAREAFEALGEPGSVAGAWHQIGIVHSEAGQFDQAERAYRQSLAILVQHKLRSNEAASLLVLGNLYVFMGRLEEAVAFHRQAADIYVELQNRIREGVARSNLAVDLIELGRYDDARRELRRAIECKQPYGHAAEPWTTWDILHDLEQATGHPKAAAQSRQQAIQCFLAYRRDGGENHYTGAQLCTMVAQAIGQGETAQAAAVLAQYANDEDTPEFGKVLIPKLQAILNGDRNPALADDSALSFDHAVELQLLLERLG